MFQEFFDAAPDAMIAVDGEGTMTRVNEQAERLFGYSKAQMLGANIEMLVPVNMRPTHIDQRMAYMVHRRVRPMAAGQELLALRRDGTTFPVEIALSPIGKPERPLIVASIRDISETRRVRQALARARFDACVTRIGQSALAATDIDAALEHATELAAEALDDAAVAIVFRPRVHGKPAIRAAFGFPDELTTELPTVFLPTDVSQHQPVLNEPVVLDNLDESHGYPGLSRFRQAGFHGAALVPLIDHGEVIGVLVALSRETDSFNHDAIHFLRSTANLLGAAIQRIRMEEQLSHAQRLEAIGQLTGGIAHDFNNLLTVISGNLQILESDLDDQPQVHDVIGSALRAVGRGAELTRNLLAFARRQRLSPSVCDPRRLLQDLHDMLKRTLGGKILLDINCPNEITPIYVDTGQLEAALVNLALNARDAMPRGGHLSLSARQYHQDDHNTNVELKPGRYVVFTVRDSGAGMSPEVLTHAFEPFFTTKHGKGSGLGLSMVYGFVKQSGGHLTAQSHPGQGTCIELHLPVATSVEKPAARRVNARNLRGTGTILVVEDETDVCAIAVDFLRSAGYSVLAASTANGALNLIANESTICLLFSDVVLGRGMSGAELAQEVRRQRPGLPVLLTSGYNNTPGEVDNEALNDIGFLPKPYQRESLLAAVREQLQQEPSKPTYPPD